MGDNDAAQLTKAEGHGLVPLSCFVPFPFRPGVPLQHSEDDSLLDNPLNALSRESAAEKRRLLAFSFSRSRRLVVTSWLLDVEMSECGGSLDEDWNRNYKTDQTERLLLPGQRGEAV